MPDQPLSVSAIPAFSDNYIWLLSRGDGPATVVDPGDAGPVITALQGRGLDLGHILVTHHHPDHVGGVPELVRRYGAQVIGPADNRIPFVDRPCAEDDTVMLDELGLHLTVFEVPAHTRSHIAFYGDGMLFCGDTLFSIGCGRFFEGTATDMQKSLDKLASLPPETKIYCAHEYTQSNCRFALQVEPGNMDLRERANEVDRLRASGEITLPSTLEQELACNPFLRTREDSVVDAVRRFSPDAEPGTQTMAAVREWKDRF